MQNHSPRRGAFIVFEGLDRSGKSTQVSILLAKLKKEEYKARIQKFPGNHIWLEDNMSIHV